MENPFYLFLFRLSGLVFVTIITMLTDKMAVLWFYIGWQVITLLFVLEKQAKRSPYTVE